MIFKGPFESKPFYGSMILTVQGDMIAVHINRTAFAQTDNFLVLITNYYWKYNLNKNNSI